MAERSYPASKVRGDGREEIPRFRDKVRRPGGVNPLLRSGATAGRSHPVPEARGGGRKEQPHAQARAVTRRRNPTPKARGSSWEEQPHIQGVVAVRAQEGLEDPSHVEGQQGWQEEIPLIQGKSSGRALLEQP